MKPISLPLLLLLCLNAFSQITFEKAYFIDNSNKRTECLIKNKDWTDNPADFEFILEEGDAPIIMDINSVKEFGIGNVSKFIRADVRIDRSNTTLRPVNYFKEPEWSDERVFLKVVIDGKAILYYFQDAYLRRYFFSVNGSTIEQLIFKEFYQEKKDKINYEGDPVLENNQFKQQLLDLMKSEEITKNDVQYLTYTYNSLVKFFKLYNGYTGESFIEYEKNVHKDVINLRVTPGITYSSLSVINKDPGFPGDYYSDNLINYRLGVEIEYILPFNNNKWGIVLEPTYQFFKNKRGNVDLKFIEFPFGPRHNFFLNESMKIYANALIIPAYCIELSSKLYSFTIDTYFNFAIGGGFNFKKYSAEIRYYTKRDLLRSKTFFYTDYQKISLIFGYQLF